MENIGIDKYIQLIGETADLEKEYLEELKEKNSDIDIEFLQEKIDPKITVRLYHLGRKQEMKEYIESLCDKDKEIPFYIDYNMHDIYEAGFDRQTIKEFNEITKFAKKQNGLNIMIDKDPLPKRLWGNIKLRVYEWKDKIQQRISERRQEALPSGEEKQQIPPTIHELENELNQDRINNQRNNESIETTKSNQEAKDNARQEKKEDDNRTKFVQTFSEECMYVLSGKTPEEIQERYDAAGGHIKFSADEIEAVFSKKGELRATERQQENEIEDKNIDTPQEEKEGEEI